MKNKILVLGSTGMLGHMVLKVFSKEKTFLVNGTDLSNSADLFYFNAEEGLEKLNLIYNKNNGYNYFINCIGIIKDKIDEKSSKSVLRSIRINTIFPHELADFAEKKDIRVIHISTDGVFSGTAECYDEDAPCDCADIYGKTKSLGEAINCNFLNIRCSIIGPSPFEKGGLFEWFQSQPEDAVISGYTNHFWNGVSTLQFAKLCMKIIKDNQFDILRKESHVFHFALNQIISKYELLNLLKTVFEKKITVLSVENKSGIIKRVLVSKYIGLKKLYNHRISMEEMIMQLRKLYN